MDDKIKNIARHVLLAFVFLSIGFSIGKELTRRSFDGRLADTGAASQIGKGETVVVYYMHATFRCATCNEIERLTRETVQKDFAAEFAGGSLEFREVNFQKDEALASKYKIATGCVVVAKIADGKDLDFVILEDVWTLHDNPSKFKEYVGAAIRGYLGN